jgi:glycerophosphoryl diester phosphodiesterase
MRASRWLAMSPVKDEQRSTAEDFLRLGVRPMAIGQHRVGPSKGAKPDPALPIENTIDSIRQAYGLAARVVEVDVQLSLDGRLAVFPDDFLGDFTCIHALTLDQLSTAPALCAGATAGNQTSRENLTIGPATTWAAS